MNVCCYLLSHVQLSETPRVPTPVFLLGESPWTEELVGYSPWGSQRVRHDWGTKHSTEGKAILISQPTGVWGLYCTSLFWGWNFSHLIRIQETVSAVWDLQSSFWIISWSLQVSHTLHFLMKKKVLVTQSCLTLCSPIDYIASYMVPILGACNFPC